MLIYFYFFWKLTNSSWSPFTVTYSKDCYILDLAVSPKKWVAIADMPDVKYLFAMVYVEAVDKLYVIGGNSMQVYVYSNKTGGWYTSSKLHDF